MSLPAILPARVPALVRMLASDQDGEVVAAARALRRTLNGVGLDINDLASRVEAWSVPRPEPVPQHYPQPTAWRWLSKHEQARFLEMALHGEVLSGWERDFARSVKDQIRQGRPTSEKQDAVCQRLYSKWMG